jgi:hypothetical protein
MKPLKQLSACDRTGTMTAAGDARSEGIDGYSVYLARLPSHKQ